MTRIDTASLATTDGYRLVMPSKASKGIEAATEVGKVGLGMVRGNNVVGEYTALSFPLALTRPCDTLHPH